VLPMSEVEIEDTWFAVGLRGTGSHHVTVKGKLVAPDQLCEFPEGPICVNGHYQAVKQTLPMVYGAFSVGVARGALDDLLAMASSGRQQLYTGKPMRDSETFQFELGQVAADVIAADAAQKGLASKMWSHACAGTLKTERMQAESTALGGWLATTCCRIADSCFSLAGGSAVYETSPLGRRMRDVHAGAQHAAIHRRHWTQMGKVLLSDAV
jgi:indole-3-acetate monooxygenase